MKISHKGRIVGAGTTVTVAALLVAFGGQLAPTASAQGRIAQMGISATCFNRNFTTMALLKPIVAKGSGGITAILPDTVSSTRYVEFDAPFLTEAMEKAGLPPTDIYVENADGSDATELAMDQAAVTAGDKVVIMDALDSGVGAKIEDYNAAHGVKTIDYDRLVLGGKRKYYDQLQQRRGRHACSATASSAAFGPGKCPSPVVLVMHGAPTDNNATLFADGYDAVLRPTSRRARTSWSASSSPVSRPRARGHRASPLPSSRASTPRNSDHQRRAHAQRRERRPDHPLADHDQGPQADTLPINRPGRNPDGSRQCPHRVPVRHGLQADLRRGPSRCGPRCLRPCRHDPAEGA